MPIRSSAAALLLAVSAVTVHADLAEIPASRDGTLYENGDLSNGAGQFMFAGETNFFDARRALIGFDIGAAIPAGSTIDSVELRLHMSRSTSGAADLRLHALLADWGEGTTDAGIPGGEGAPAAPGDATWTHAFFGSTLWATPGGDFNPAASATTSVADTGFYSWSGAGLVADVQAWLDGAAANYGWALLGPENDATTAKRFDTRENSNTSFHPELIVNYTVPAPGAAGVLVLASLAAARRRRS